MKRPNNTCIIGMTGSGKSYMTRKLVNQLPAPKSNRFLISPTSLFDDTFKTYVYSENTFQMYDDSIVDYIIETVDKARKATERKFHYRIVTNRETGEIEERLIKSRVNKKPKYKQWVVILDDVIGTSACKPNSKVANLFTVYNRSGV